jgi:hypothetical protein
MAKTDDADLKQLGSEASQAIGPMKKEVEDAFKSAFLMSKNPNPKVAELLASQVEGLISSANDMKGLLKDLKAATK